MKLQEEALAALARGLSTAEITYMVVGGYANAVWGEPRATLDIDVLLWRPEPAVGELLDLLGPGFRPRVDDPVAFVEETRVLPVVLGEATQVDLIFGLFPFEQQAIQRAAEVEFGGVLVRVATAEDLILLKISSPREKDIEDIRGVMRRRRDDLDFEYLDPLVQQLSDVLERPEILRRWLALREPQP